MKNLEEYQVATLSRSQAIEIEGGGAIGEFFDRIKDGMNAIKSIKQFFSGRPQT